MEITNSSYFHRSVRSRQSISEIGWLTDDEGNQHHPLEQIKDFANKYFQRLLGSRDPNVTSSPDALAIIMQKTLNLDSVATWEADITEEEIKHTLNGNKALSPNGFKAQIFKDTWHVIGDSVAIAFFNFFPIQV